VDKGCRHTKVPSQSGGFMKKVKYYMVETDKCFFYAKCSTKKKLVDECKFLGHKNIVVNEKPEFLMEGREVENWL
jgi:hypothetical protein